VANDQKPSSGGARYIAEQFVENLKGMFTGLQEDINRVEHITIPGIFDILRKHGEDIATLKVKAGLWGLLGGMIPAVGVAIYFLLSKTK